MIRRFRDAVCATGLLLLAFSMIVPAGDQIPQTAGRLDMSQWEGSVVLVDFWASWCAPCRKSFPWMAEMLEKYEDQGLVIVTVSIDKDRDAAQKFLAGKEFPFHHLDDPDGSLAAEAPPTGDAVITASLMCARPPPVQVSDEQQARLLSDEPPVRPPAKSAAPVTVAAIPTAIADERVAGLTGESLFKSLSEQGVQLLRPD